MNRPFVFTTLATAALLVAAVGCVPNSNVAPATESLSATAEFTPTANRFATSLAVFANNVRYFDNQSPAISRPIPGVDLQNFMVAPLGLNATLALLLNGAGGQTAEELRRVLALNLAGLTPDQFNPHYASLMANLPRVDPAVTLRLGNAIWYDNKHTIAEAFSRQLAPQYGITLSAANFNLSTTLTRINDWASQQSGGQINRIFDVVQSGGGMYLTNVTYFQGPWTTRFDPAQTTDALFTMANGQPKTVRMMRLTITARRAYWNEFSVVELPFGNGQFAMTILCPLGKHTADAMLQLLDGQGIPNERDPWGDATEGGWPMIQRALREGVVDIGLPKFSLRYESERLIEVLQRLGIMQSFSTRADFTRFSPGGRISLGLPKQVVQVAIDERGMAAPSAVDRATLVDPPVVCDRPFVFVIHEKTSGAVLFVGKVANP